MQNHVGSILNEFLAGILVSFSMPMLQILIKCLCTKEDTKTLKRMKGSGRARRKDVLKKALRTKLCYSQTIELSLSGFSRLFFPRPVSFSGAAAVARED